MKLKEKLKAAACVTLSCLICVFAFFCVYKSVGRCIDVSGTATLLAAFSVMPDGKFTQSEKSEKPSSDKPKNSSKKTDENTTKAVARNTSKTDEKTYHISEVDLSGGGVQYKNFSISNSTSYDIDVDKMLESELPFEIKDTHQAQVLIVHTHTCESYMDRDNGFYYESFYPRTTDKEKNVIAVGEAISNSLKAQGIGVVHATVLHDDPSYDGAYDRSYATIMKYLKKYKEIKVVLDIHRDSMTQDDMTRLKPTFTYNGKKAAQIMIMTGHDDSLLEFPFWEDNLNFALKLQSACETMYKGFTRPLNFGDFTYNMNVNTGSLLIEVGTDANTLDEAVRSGEMLGNALAQVLQKS